MSWGTSGFGHALTTKLLMSVSAVASIAATAGRDGLSPPDLGMSRLEAWRLLTSNLVFTSAGEMVFGFGLLYYLRTFERLMGTAKYTAYALVVSALSAFIQLALSKAVLDPPVRNHQARLSSGPYSVIFASMVLFARDIPATQRFPLGPGRLQIMISDKSFVYGTALQLLYSNGYQSAVPAVSGLLAGLLYRANVGRIADFRFPQRLCKAAEKAAEKLSFALGAAADAGQGAAGAEQRQTEQEGAGMGEEAAGAWGRAQPGGGAPGPALQRAGALHAGLGAAQGAPPSQEAVEVLVSMGFDRQEATAALQMGGNNLSVAMELLLNGNDGADL